MNCFQVVRQEEPSPLGEASGGSCVFYRVRTNQFWLRPKSCCWKWALAQKRSDFFGEVRKSVGKGRRAEVNDQSTVIFQMPEALPFDEPRGAVDAAVQGGTTGAVRNLRFQNLRFESGCVELPTSLAEAWIRLCERKVSFMRRIMRLKIRTIIRGIALVGVVITAAAANLQRGRERKTRGEKFVAR